MTDTSTKTDENNKNNELVVSTREEDISENLWVIGISKTHPGLKYYFNAATGVSLWNISKEDMERAKQTMKANGNQPQYLNCPEPKEPPPSKKITPNLSTQTYCEHISRQSKSYNKQLIDSGPGFTCDICYASMNSSPNVITVNFRQCPTCIPVVDNACSSVSHSQIQPSTAFLNASTIEKNQYNRSPNDLIGNKRTLNRNIAETITQDSSNEHFHSQRVPDSDIFNYNTGHFENLDLSPLKMFAKNGLIEDKWYIIADADVYLHHITFLKNVMHSDTQCCLMVPQNVKIELENAIKTEHRTKAYCANYYIYSMFDYGLARFDEDNSTRIQDKSNEEHILECCSKLKEENFYVVVISNDIELQKYRNKIYIPIFTVTELKEYLCKSNHSVTTKSPESAFNVSQSSKNIRVITNNTSMLNNKLSDIHNSIKSNLDVPVKRNQKVQTTLAFNDNGTQVQGFEDISKITAHAEVQTNFNFKQLEEMENTYKNNVPNHSDVIKKRKETPISGSQSCDPSLNSSIPGPGKRIKLRRRKVSDQTKPNLTSNLLNHCESHTSASNNGVSVFPSNENVSQDKMLQERNRHNTNVDEIMKPIENTISTHTLKQKNEENYLISKSTLKSDQGTVLHMKSINDNIENKNVMFEVTNDLMDQSLRRKCDEWVSRFVQIMEEALTQVLTKNSSLFLPPPWNMYEAAICIEKRFNKDEDVADASKKFLNILNRICDEKGNVNANISPTQYMEMYSFGVYMIDALQGIFSTCEDLQAAAESLSKLLNDIQDPDSDARNIEVFNCASQEELPNNSTEDDNEKVEVLMIIETDSLSNERTAEDTGCLLENDISNNKIGKSKDGTLFRIPFSSIETSNNCISNEDNAYSAHNNFKAEDLECNKKSQEDIIVTRIENSTGRAIDESSPSRYNLRTRKITISPEKQNDSTLPKESRSGRTYLSKNAFLSNFLLQKSQPKEKSHILDDGFGEKDLTKNINYLESSNIKVNEGLTGINSNASDLSHKAKLSSEPKVVRNFVICSEFEKRLKTRYVHDDMEEFDIEEDFEDYMNEEVSSTETGRLHIDEFAEFGDNATNFNWQLEQESPKNAQFIEIDFKYFIRRIADEIKEVSSEVHNFSKNACETLNSLSTSYDKRDIRKKAEQMDLYTNKLCNALSNILDRDKRGGHNVQALLKRTEFGEILVDEDQMEVYGEFISRCLEQAQYLKNTIKDILSAACEL